MSADGHHCCNVEEEPLQNDPAGPPAHSEQPPSSESVQPYVSCLRFASYIILFILFLVCTLVVWLVVDYNLINLLDDTPPSGSGGDQTGFYARVKKVEATTKEFAKRAKFIHSRLVIFVLTWLIVNLTVSPGLKNKLVLGSELWKWTLLVTLVLCGYSFISLATASLLKLLCLWSKFKRNPNAEYYARGLRRSTNLVVFSWSVLLTWILYFKTSRGIRRTPETKGLLHVGAWTFFSLAVASLLWLLKSVLLLMWEANVVYNRFRERILGVRLHQFFLGHLCDFEDKKRLDVFRPEVSSSSNDETGASDEGKTTTFDIQRMAEYFVVLSVASSRDDDGTSQVLAKCEQLRPRGRPSQQSQLRFKGLPTQPGVNKKDITAKDLSMLLNLGAGKDANLREKYAELLLSDLKKEQGLEKISYDQCVISMVKAQKNCLAVGHSLSDAKDAVKVLNKVMTAVLVAIVIVAWLLLTNIATNKILVLIASPFLAATFIFGEACKKMFEGIVFSFISHPFDVGDLCIIDDNELEVKCMGILTTKFLLIGKKREVLYPNSILATKSIINLKEEPEPNDHVELKLTNIMSIEKYKNLEGKIKSFLKEKPSFEDAFSITLEDIGEGTKIVIQYRLHMSIKTATHSQCLEKKREQKSVLLKQIAKFIEDVGVVTAADAPPADPTSDIKPSNV